MGGHIFESGEATEQEMIEERQRLGMKNELLLLKMVEEGPMSPPEKARVAKQIGALSAEDALGRGDITLVEFARRDLMEMESQDEREAGIPPIIYNGKPYSASELTAYLESKGLKFTH